MISIYMLLTDISDYKLTSAVKFILIMIINWTPEMCWSLMCVIAATKFKLCRQFYIFCVLHDFNNIMKINIPTQNF